MKILILQLARLGDIYQTWPVIRAIKRSNPQAQIHVLARKKFAAACDGQADIDRVHLLDTRSVLEPLVDEQPNFKKSLGQIDLLVNQLNQERFDKIVNLSFSPLSSFLTQALSFSGAEVRGYSRHSDGFFNPVDDASAYFYAQVGPGLPNRVHLTELFAQVAGVELRDEDWVAGRQNSSKHSRVGSIVLHLGASETKKAYGSHKWLQVAKSLLEKTNREVLLIGSAEERDLGFVVENVTSQRKPINLVGKTEINELFDIISQASLVIGCDSAPIHIAALTNTPVLNLSFSSVNFFETGPKSSGSRILIADVPEGLSSDSVVEEAIAMLNGGVSKNINVVNVAKSRLHPYVQAREVARTGEWEMIQAVYMGNSFPVIPTPIFKEAILRLFDTNELAIEQVRQLRKNPSNKVAHSILNRVDEILSTIEKMVPSIGVIVRWFQTERIRLGPVPQAELLDLTESLHLKLKDILSLYSPQTEGERYDDVGVG